MYLNIKYHLKTFSVCTIVNGAPAPACFDDCQKNILKLADVFCVNESEAEIFTNSVIKIDGITSASQVLSLLLEKCGNIVIITLGPLGVIYASVDKPEPQWVEALCVKNPVDTTVSIFIQFFIFHCCAIVTNKIDMFIISGCW